MTMHPDLMKAIVLAAIIRMPDHSKRQLVSMVQQRREKAEDAVSREAFNADCKSAGIVSMPIRSHVYRGAPPTAW